MTDRRIESSTAHSGLIWSIEKYFWVLLGSYKVTGTEHMKEFEQKVVYLKMQMGRKYKIFCDSDTQLAKCKFKKGAGFHEKSGIR